MIPEYENGIFDFVLFDIFDNLKCRRHLNVSAGILERFPLEKLENFIKDEWTIGFSANTRGCMLSLIDDLDRLLQDDEQKFHFVVAHDVTLFYFAMDFLGKSFLKRVPEFNSFFCIEMEKSDLLWKAKLIWDWEDVKDAWEYQIDARDSFISKLKGNIHQIEKEINEIKSAKK